MKLDYQKELTPVLYGKKAVKVLSFSGFSKDHGVFTKHWHERMEIILVTSGGLNITLNDRQFNIDKDTVAAIPHGVTHSAVTTADNTSYHAIMFDIDAFRNSVPGNEPWISALLKPQNTITLVTKDEKTVETLKNLVEAYTSNDNSSTLLVTAYIYMFLAHFCSNLTEQVKLPQNNRNELGEIITYIDEHFTEPLTTSLLCKKFGYAEGYFCRRFKSLTGMTPTDYIKVLKLEHARRILDSDNISVGDVASLCGFSDRVYFTRCFKRQYSQTPTEYLKNRQ